MANHSDTSANLLLLVFLALPIVAFILTRWFLKSGRKRLHSRATSLICGNLLVMAFLVSVVILSGEIYFRFFCDSTDSFGLTRISRRWFDRHIRRNAMGLRDNVNYLTGPSPDQVRITFVGDSFTFGHGIENVEDRFANHVRRLRPDSDVQVFAECGWDTDAEIEAITRLTSLGMHIDTVVLVYCLNDISDIVPEWQQILENIYSGPDPGFLVANSYLFNTLHARIRMVRDPQISEYYSFVLGAYESSIWEKQQDRLKRFKQVVTDSGGRLCVVTFPFLHAVGSDYAFQSVHAQLDQFWRDLEVPHLDLWATYQSVPGDELVLSRQDAHPSKHAHKLAGAAIAEFLDKQIAAERDPVPQKTDMP